MYKKILVGYDGSDGSKVALQKAIELAKESNAALLALWVRESLPHFSDLPGEFEEEKEAAEEFFETIKKEVAVRAKSCGLQIACDSQTGHPAKILVQCADEGGYDLIVLGHSGHSGLWGRLLGHTADRVSEHAHCSVLIVR